MSSIPSGPIPPFLPDIPSTPLSSEKTKEPVASETPEPQPPTQPEAPQSTSVTNPEDLLRTSLTEAKTHQLTSSTTTALPASHLDEYERNSAMVRAKLFHIPKKEDYLQEVSRVKDKLTRARTCEYHDLPTTWTITKLLLKFIHGTWLISFFKKIGDLFRLNNTDFLKVSIPMVTTKNLGLGESELSEVLQFQPHSATLHIPETIVDDFHKRSHFISPRGEHANLLYLQKVTANENNSILEFETASMGPRLSDQVERPSSFLKADKIVCLRHAAEARKDDKTSRVLYALPFVFADTPEDHITNIVIDFTNKKILFFDSKGKSIDKAQKMYNLTFDLRKDLEKISMICFGQVDSPLMDEPHHFQYDANSCGKWVALHLETLLKTPNAHECIERMKQGLDPQGKKQMSVGEYGESIAQRLVSTRFKKAFISDIKSKKKRLKETDLYAFIIPPPKPHFHLTPKTPIRQQKNEDNTPSTLRKTKRIFKKKDHDSDEFELPSL